VDHFGTPALNSDDDENFDFSKADPKEF